MQIYRSKWMNKYFKATRFSDRTLSEIWWMLINCEHRVSCLGRWSSSLRPLSFPIVALYQKLSQIRKGMSFCVFLCSFCVFVHICILLTSICTEMELFEAISRTFLSKTGGQLDERFTRLRIQKFKETQLVRWNYILFHLNVPTIVRFLLCYHCSRGLEHKNCLKCNLAFIWKFNIF